MQNRYEVIRTLLDRIDIQLVAQHEKYNGSRGGAGVGGPVDTFLLGDQLSYVDVNFCSLAAPLLMNTLVLTDSNNGQSYYANGRFTSFATTKITSPTPKPLLELEADMLDRPVGRYLVKMYKKYRKHSLFTTSTSSN